jgi:sugar phosphate isomerase/epimerase
MIIYPKTSENLEGLEYLKRYAEEYRGIEIQLLSYEHTQKITYNVIKQLKSQIPQLEEVTIHLPIREDFNFEALAFSKIDFEKERLKMLCEASQEFNMKLNLLYHTRWNYISWSNSGAIDRMKELLEVIQNTNVNILIENIYAIVERKECSVLKVAKQIDDDHLKVCLDTCHLHCVANMFKISLNEYLNTYLNKEDCKKYIQQIHFAGTLDNDGVIDKRTHGRMHDSWESFEEDFNILKRFGIENKIIVTEVSEDDYSTRKDQIEEIKMLIKKDEEK